MKSGRIVKVSGPLVTAEGMEDANIQDICHVGHLGLIGEIIEMRKGVASIQVYEETSGIGPGEPVTTTGEALSVELAPGIISQMFDGIQRPLNTFKEVSNSDFLVRGTVVAPLDRQKEWEFRQGRPFKVKKNTEVPMLTGQRVIDTFFPVTKGGAAAVPGPFGAGKTVVQHQIAKWSDVDIVVYVGCGERGNEMTDVLNEFPELIDPTTGESIMERTILIANTSNMPVAAREASIYTGITIAEYYRDMGYHVAIMADSTSRWAEALREISGRLEEMPAEEGYPAYLPSRIAQFYERAGYVKTLSKEEGSITVIGAVSPPGGDFSEPVTENTKRFVSAFIGLDKNLAYIRHYPAVNYLTSYSGYTSLIKEYYDENVSPELLKIRAKMMELLSEDNKLNQIVQLVGEDVLPNDQRIVIEIAKVLKKGFLQQNAMHETDCYVPLKKQFEMLKVIDKLYINCTLAVKEQVSLTEIKNDDLFEEVIKMKYNIPNENYDEAFEELNSKIDSYYTTLISENQGE